MTALGETRHNGAVWTFATPNEQTLVLRNGLLTATRELGDDLMSAKTGAAEGLILRRQTGTADRIYRYLDGGDRAPPMTCTVTTGPAKSFDFAAPSRHEAGG